MKLPKTEKFLSEGIKMVRESSRGFFGSTYEYKTVSLEEAVKLSRDGWGFEPSMAYWGFNLALFLQRDLKDLQLPELATQPDSTLPLNSKGETS